MPFCKQCGARHSKFDETCPGCGSPVGVGAVPEGPGPKAPESRPEDDWLDERMEPVAEAPTPGPVQRRPPGARKPRAVPETMEVPDAPEPAAEAPPDDIPPEFRDGFDEFSGPARPSGVSFEEERPAGPAYREFGHADDGTDRAEDRGRSRRPDVEFENEPDIEFEADERYDMREPERRPPVRQEDVDWGGPPRQPYDDRYVDRYDDGRPAPYRPGPYDDRYAGPPGWDQRGPPGPTRHEPTAGQYAGDGPQYRNSKKEVYVPKSGPVTFMDSFTAKAGVIVLVLSAIGLLLAYNLPWFGITQEWTEGDWDGNEERVKAEVRYDHDLEESYFHSSMDNHTSDGGRIEGKMADTMRERIDLCMLGLMMGIFIGGGMIVAGLLVDGPRPVYSSIVMASLACVVLLMSVLVMYSAATTMGVAVSADLTDLSFHSTDSDAMNDRSRTWVSSDGGSACFFIGLGILFIGLLGIRRAMEDATPIPKKAWNGPGMDGGNAPREGWPEDHRRRPSPMRETDRDDHWARAPPAGGSYDDRGRRDGP